MTATRARAYELARLAADEIECVGGMSYTGYFSTGSINTRGLAALEQAFFNALRQERVEESPLVGRPLQQGHLFR